MPTREELELLLTIPSESPSVEYKSWLNLSENPGRAILAKAAIAIANEGGGIIALGMREDVGEGGRLGSQRRPPGLRRYSQNEINAAIARFAEPAFHCGLDFARHPDTENEHAFVVVPGGMNVPVMSRRGCEGIISPQRCYVRKPGPRSEEPFTAEEWRGVLERCLQARRESMLNAIRIIVQGHGSPLTAAAEVRNALASYSDAARRRWEGLVEGLPQDAPGRMPHGHYELEFELVGVPTAGTARELLRRMTEASRVRHTGWGPFVQLTRQPLEPRSVDGNVEVWLGSPEVERAHSDPSHCDFWRAHPSGLLFLLRGYDEDGQERVRPGTALDFTMPIWRVGEAMLYASRLAEQFDHDDPDVLVRCRYFGLSGRRLTSLEPRRRPLFEPTSIDDYALLETQASARQIDDNLVEILHPLLVPLYERFGFFELSRDLVQVEVTQLRSRRF